jgi:hypothetical protein
MVESAGGGMSMIIDHSGRILTVFALYLSRPQIIFRSKEGDF